MHDRIRRIFSANALTRSNSEEASKMPEHSLAIMDLLNTPERPVEKRL